MRVWIGVLWFIWCGCAVAGPTGAIMRATKSFLTPQKFPSTIQDTSFVQRTQVLAQGYEAWESEYDSSGRCISGCAYPGMTLEEEVAYLQRQTDLAIQQLKDSGEWPWPEDDKKPVVNADKKPQEKKQDNFVILAPSVQWEKTPQPGSSSVKPGIKKNENISNSCSPRQETISEGQNKPFGEPLNGKPVITSPYGVRVHPITGNRHNHKAVDFGVPRGTDVFTTASGVVARVWTDDICGRGIRIRHSDGYETVYCHLDTQLVQVGQQVEAGCLIGKSGSTGQSTGPHLHYAILCNGAAQNPQKYIRQ